jgi:DNA-binding NtrC family response regulator
MNPVAITRNPDSVLLREFSKLDSSFETRVYRSPEEAYLALSSAKCGALLLDLDSYQDSQSLTSIGDLLTFGVSANRFQRLVVTADGGVPTVLAGHYELLSAGSLVSSEATGGKIRQYLQELTAVEAGRPALNSPQSELSAPVFTLSTPDGLKFKTRSHNLIAVLQQIRRIAERDVTVLLIGETGSGKSFLARVLHGLSHRCAAPFVVTPCGSLPREIIESELFGHVRGAYTGADRTKIGRFEAAGKGTLLLDEIDVLGPSEQARLLHVIETGRFEPVGSTESRKSEARLIAASNVNLRSIADSGSFRSDLYFRLSVLEFRLPNLVDRPLDILMLMSLFIDEAATEFGIPVDRLSINFLRCVRKHSWPGNVRELRNQVRRCVLLSQDGLIDCEHLSAHVRNGQTSLAPNEPERFAAFSSSKTYGGSHGVQNERERVLAALQANADNRSATARSLGISRVALYKKMTKLGLHTPGKPR